MDIVRKVPTQRRSETSRATFLAATLAGAALLALAPPARAAALVIDGKSDWLFPGWESLTDPGTAGIERNVKTIDATQRVFKAAGIALLVLVVPLKARFYPDRLPNGVALSPTVQARYTAILSALAANSTPTMDAYAVMKGLTQPTFFRTDYHWTEWSSEAVAQACAKELQSLVTLPRSTVALPPLTGWAVDHNMGDLVALLPPDRQKAIAPEALTTRIVDASRFQLLDPAKADVHVVGNSFSMPYLGFPEMLAETIAQPVGVTAKFGNAGPWETMIEYLESPAFAKRRPRAVVWQFEEGLFMQGPASTGFWDVASLMSEDLFLARVAKAVPPAIAPAT